MTDRIRPLWSTSAHVPDTVAPSTKGGPRSAQAPSVEASAGVMALLGKHSPSNSQAFVAQATARPVDSTSGEGSHSAGWYFVKGLSEAGCAVLTCKSALVASKAGMPDGGIAQAMMDHFVSGNAEPVSVDLNREFERNPRLREVVASKIEFLLSSRAAQDLPIEGATGAVWVSQGDYGGSDAGNDQRLSLGGTYFEFNVTGSADTGGLVVSINVADNYFWSPSDDSRAGQCFHECAVELVNEGRAVEFDQVGEGQLVVADPRTSERMAIPPPSAQGVQ